MADFPYRLREDATPTMGLRGLTGARRLQPQGRGQGLDDRVGVGQIEEGGRRQRTHRLARGKRLRPPALAKHQRVGRRIGAAGVHQHEAGGVGELRTRLIVDPE